jgi:hypothetical protein
MTLMLRFSMLAALFFSAVIGVSHAKSVNPKRLEKVDPPVVHQLASDVTVEGHHITYTIRAGTYLLLYKDRGGLYFVGEGNCMHLYIHTPKMTGTNDWTCGIYVPNDTSRGASFFRIRPVGQTHSEMGPVVNAIIRYGFGSFDWPDKAESMELRNQLNVGGP